MSTTHPSGGYLSSGLASRTDKRNTAKGIVRSISRACSRGVFERKSLNCANLVCHSHLSAKHRLLSSLLVPQCRKFSFPVVRNKLTSDFDVGSSDVEERFTLEEGNAINGSREDISGSAEIPIYQYHSPDVKRELVMLTLPAIAGQAIEPLAQLMETAYIGRLGFVELGSAGVAITIFNIISKLFNIPLLSIATSFVAEDISKNAIKGSASEEGMLEDNTNGKPFGGVAERKQLSSVSTALVLAVGIGIFEAIALYAGSGIFLNLMGISPESPMHIPAKQFLSLRAIGAPAVVLSLALQGILRGFKDTKTPVLCLGIGNLSAVFLFPLLMYTLQMGVVGAAISSVLSQYIITGLMIWYVNKRVVLLPPKPGSLQFGNYIKSGGFLLGRTLAVLTTLTLGTSMAARQGPVAMAAHQICLQVWMAVSLLTDALASSSQAVIASYVSKGDYKTVREVTNFVLKIGLLTGVVLAVILGASFSSLANVFTKDTEVLGIVRTGVLFVSASQPLNALAFIFDGLHYGVSDFSYAAYSMMLVGAISSAYLLFAPSIIGLPGVWSGLTLFMGLRMVAGFIRLLSTKGPWWFMHTDSMMTKEYHSKAM